MIRSKLTERDLTTIFADAVSYADSRTDLDAGTAVCAYLQQELPAVVLVMPPHVWPMGRPDRIPSVYKWLLEWYRRDNS